MKITAVIMAGGKGERFWPKSRENHPKQFLSLTHDGETMIQKTVKRIGSLVEQKDIFIVTNECYKKIVMEQLPDVPEENILSEPYRKNTAPCIAFATEIIRKKYDDAVMMVLPADHLIKDESAYTRTLCSAIATATEKNNLVTIGITPTYPETGYGYINLGEKSGDAYKVNRFVEKPDLCTAEKYLSSGDYLWNSGMFIWKASSIEERFKKYMPDVYEGAKKIGNAFGTENFEQILKTEYNKFVSESIDFGIMEKASDIYIVAGNFGWDDVGNWLAVERINQTDEHQNYTEGDVVSENCNNITVCGGKRLIATIGIKDVIIVDTDDAVLVCSKNNTQDIKKIIEHLKENSRTELI